MNNANKTLAAIVKLDANLAAAAVNGQAHTLDKLSSAYRTMVAKFEAAGGTRDEILQAVRQARGIS